tara:strand:- start:942 stop:2294 length:1353 start_codon:yes stop_codon:yes gene_type:complete
MADIQVVNTDADLSGNTLVTEENAYTITGLHTYSRSTSAPFAVNSGAAVVANLDADKLDGVEASGFVKANGTVALSANWDAGAYEIRAQTLEADVSTGTAPLTIASTTKVANLNADKLDDQEGSYYIDPGNLSSAVAVNKGGTGATTLTDGGVLLGSGTSAITATAVLGDGVILIGDASGDPTTLDVGSSTAITTLGTVATGVWEGTDVGVAHGGTGRSTLTDGGILIGKGTAAINQMAVLADGEMVVGDGTTDPVAEAGSTLRASIGCDAAGNITSGTVATARLGSGTASSSTFLRGDGSWNAAGGGATSFIGAANGSTTTTADTMYGSTAISGLAVTDTIMCTWSFTNSGGNILDPRIVQGSVSTQFGVCSENNINNTNSGVSYMQPAGATLTIVQSNGLTAYSGGGGSVGAGFTVADFTGSYNLGIAFGLVGGTTVWQIQFFKIEGS